MQQLKFYTLTEDNMKARSMWIFTQRQIDRTFLTIHKIELSHKMRYTIERRHFEPTKKTDLETETKMSCSNIWRVNPFANSHIYPEFNNIYLF